ncbi:SipA protein [Streptococcus pneumoniae]|nr:SipA protein [Streptococcus pneumoniae]
MGLFFYNKIGSIISIVDLPTTNIIEPDLLVYSYKGKERVARVIATEGSTIDINENGLIINGSPQQEQDIYKETLLYKEGATFSMKVPAGQLFVLGDNRTTAVDSRAFGTIPIQDTQGKVVTVIRRRGF